MTVPADAPLDATAVTRSLNRAVLDALPFADTQDFDDARRGFVATLPSDAKDFVYVRWLT